MLEAAGEALSFARGRRKDELRTDRMLALALVKEIEIIGEAASKLSLETKRSLPSIPWADIAGMRNRLVHVYFDIDFDILWDTVGSTLDPLISQLEPLLRGRD